MKKIIDKELIFVVLLFIAGLGAYVINGRIEASLIVAIGLFIAGLVLLIKGGDWFVDAASAIAGRFHVPEVLIGATVVSIGTTLPEVMVSSQAALKGNSGISYGNAIGSIICNVSLIAAITIACKPAKVEKKSLKVPVFVFFIAAAFYCFNAYAFRSFSRISGIILLAIFVVYMVIVVIQAVKSGHEGNAAESKEVEDKTSDGDADKEIEDKTSDGDADMETDEAMSMGRALVFLIFGAAVIAFGATLLVDNGTIIATCMGVPEAVVALTFVALGTSLPELVTAITSLAKGKGALSLGNIIGANIFNLVLVSGMAITLKPFEVPCDPEKMMLGLPQSLVIDIPVMLAVMLILALPALIKGKLYRAQGILLLLTYAAFCTLQFVL